MTTEWSASFRWYQWTFSDAVTGTAEECLRDDDRRAAFAATPNSRRRSTLAGPAGWFDESLHLYEPNDDEYAEEDRIG
jgi:hypothetical protein